MESFDRSQGRKDWLPWVFVARGYLNLLEPGYQALITAAEGVQRYSDIVTWDTAATRRHVNHDFPCSALHTPGQEVVEHYGRVATTSKPESPYVRTMRVMAEAGITGIIAPAWESVKEIDFLEIRRYEVQSASSSLSP